MQQKTAGGIERARAKRPAVCYLFDCLYLDGRPIMNEPLSRRQEWLKDAVRANPAYRISEAVADGPAFFKAVEALGLEGVVAKQRHSLYLPGKRSDAWLKIKTRQTAECIIIGYTRGTGDRARSFGALHLAQRADGDLKYVGKVGSGFDERSLKSVAEKLKKLEIISRPIREKPLDDARSIWLKSNLLCEVQFASWTQDGALREPAFLRLRPDLSI
jgi:ATP-dependent DNA ligase